MRSTVLVAGISLLLACTAFPSPGDLDLLDGNISGSTIYATAVQPDGRIVIAGSFSSVLGASRNNIARLNVDGTLDSGFNPNPNHEVRNVVVQSDGKLVIGGLFTALQPNGELFPTPRNRVARLNADGTLDASFDPNANGEVRVAMLQPDGRLILAGSFTALQPNGAVSPTTRNRIARLNSDGTLDNTFDPNSNDLIFSAALQPDGKILLGGRFTSLRPNGASAPTTRNYIARIHNDGTLDLAFDPNANDWVFCVTPQADGKILLGGQFTTLQPTGAVSATTRNRIARVNVDGTLDTTFDPNSNSWVYSAAVQADGKILLAGFFTTLRPNGAALATTRNRIARINADGTLDTTFNPSANGVVRGVAIQADGRVLLGGDFNALQPNGATVPTPRGYLARVQNDVVSQTLEALDTANVLWQRSGALPEFSSVSFELSTNSGTTWSPLGAGIRVGATSNWQLTNGNLPSGGLLRARGVASGGYLTSSSSLIEQVTSFSFSKIVVEHPVGVGLANDSSKNFGVILVGEPATLTFVVKNSGQSNLTGLETTKHGVNPADFVIAASPIAPVAPNGSTALMVNFAPSSSGTKSCVIHIASNDSTANPFNITLTGVSLSYADDTDGDGLNDASEFKMSVLGFDWQVAQPALVATLYSNANGAGLYNQTQYDANRLAGRNDVINLPNAYSLFTTSQIQALNIGTPLLQQDSSGIFTLTLSVQKSTNLIHFTPFPITTPQASIDGQGRIQIQFSSPDNAAFFKILAQ